MKVFRAALLTICLWIASGALLIYSGNSIAFGTIIGGFIAVPVWIAHSEMLFGEKGRKIIGRVFDIIWLVLFLYVLIELFDVTSSEIVLTSTLLILAFSKWKEITVKYKNCGSKE